MNPCSVSALYTADMIGLVANPDVPSSATRSGCWTASVSSARAPSASRSC